MGRVCVSVREEGVRRACTCLLSLYPKVPQTAQSKRPHRGDRQYRQVEPAGLISGVLALWRGFDRQENVRVRIRCLQSAQAGGFIFPQSKRATDPIPSMR